MGARREAVFVCTITTRSAVTSIWVRAWTADQARELVASQLRDRGLARFEVDVVPLAQAHELSEAAR